MSSEKNRQILISGAGIAGLTLAFWLKKWGFEPVVVEHAPELRTGGYMIDFWGLGFVVAERMGIIDELGKQHYNIPEIVFVNNKGKRVGGFNIEKLRKLLHYKHFNMLRGNLVSVIYETVKNEVEIIYSNTVIAIEEGENGVQITFSDGTQRNFDLIVGADGLHSTVRRIVFGPEEEFERHLGYYVSSFIIENYMDDPNVFQSFTVQGKWASIYSIAENKLAAFFSFKSNKKYFSRHNTEEQQNTLIEVFKDLGWQCSKLLKEMPAASDFYFDDVSQIKMSNWSNGRITLIGDACHCASIIAGRGASLAMASAYILAGELKKNSGDYESAFKNYERKLKPEVLRIQKLGREFAPNFVPDSLFGIWKRNIFTWFMFLPFVSKMFIKQFLSDNFNLEHY